MNNLRSNRQNTRRGTQNHPIEIPDSPPAESSPSSSVEVFLRLQDSLPRACTQECTQLSPTRTDHAEDCPNCQCFECGLSGGQHNRDCNRGMMCRPLWCTHNRMCHQNCFLHLNGPPHTAHHHVECHYRTPLLHCPGGCDENCNHHIVVDAAWLER